jgi:hypothetical protein
MVAVHMYLYQESRGLLRPLPDGSYPLIRRRCGEPSCLNPIHLTAGTAAGQPVGAMAAGPAADVRSPQGRAAAIRDAIVRSIAAGAMPGEIEAAIEAAAVAGIPAVQTALPFPGGIRRPPGQGRDDAQMVAAAAASPMVIPAGQGELF